MNYKELINLEGKYTQSTIDDDLYKINVQCAFFHLFPRAKVKYKYILRSKVKFPKGFASALRAIIQQYPNLEAPKHTEEFLYSRAPYLPPTFINFILNFRFDPSEVGIIQHSDDSLEIDIEGYLFTAQRWEVVLMATISELYFLMTGEADDINIEKANNSADKAAHLRTNGIYFSDFGTRRRFSYQNHLLTVKRLNYGMKNFIGTSNVHIALQEDIKPIGTQGHEWFMFHLAMYGPRMANIMGMHNWADVFDGDNGIVLPDTFTTPEFLKVFSKRMSKLYDGIRHDSGDPEKFTDDFVNHYQKLSIDHTTKSYIYSNGLSSLEDCNKVVDYGHQKHKIPRYRLPLGIGTWFTNDVGVTPLNQVIKMWSAQPVQNGRWVDVVKISDSFGKVTGNPKEAELVMNMLGADLKEVQNEKK